MSVRVHVVRPELRSAESVFRGSLDALFWSARKEAQADNTRRQALLPSSSSSSSSSSSVVSVEQEANEQLAPPMEFDQPPPDVARTFNCVVGQNDRPSVLAALTGITHCAVCSSARLSFSLSLLLSYLGVESEDAYRALRFAPLLPFLHRPLLLFLFSTPLLDTSNSSIAFSSRPFLSFLPPLSPTLSLPSLFLLPITTVLMHVVASIAN